MASFIFISSAQTAQAQKAHPEEAFKNIPIHLSSKVNLAEIKRIIFNQINSDRLKNKLTPVIYDLTSEKAGDVQILNQIRLGEYLGHVTPSGELPYMRYSEAGGYDFNAENSSMAFIYQNLVTKNNAALEEKECQSEKTWGPLTADNIQNTVIELALNLHCNMYNEKAPHDGHRQAILNPAFNAVGISIGLTVVPELAENGKVYPALHLYLNQEFATRALKNLTPLPLSISLTQSKYLNFGGELPPGYDLNQVQLFFENKILRAAAQCRDIDSYGFPSTNLTYMPPPPTGFIYPEAFLKSFSPLASGLELKGSRLSLPINFSQGPGVYTIVVVIQGHTEGKPFPVTSRSVVVTK